MTAVNSLDVALDAQVAAADRRFGATVRWAAGLSSLVALLGVLSYAPGLQLLGQVRREFIPMAPSTAVCVIVLTGALQLTGGTPVRRALRLLVGLMVLVCAAFSLLEFIGLFLQRDLPLEDWVGIPIRTLNGLRIGRMAPTTGAALFSAGCGTFLLILGRGRSRRAMIERDAAAILGVVTSLIASIAFLAYVYGEPFNYGQFLTPMAVTTAVALLFLGVAVIAAAGPSSWTGRLLVGQSTSAILSRAFVPLVVLALLVHGVVFRIGHLVTDVKDVTIALIAAFIVAALTIGAVWRLSHRLGSAFDERSRHLRESEARYRVITQSANDAIVTIDSNDIIVSWNPAAQRIFGYADTEVIGASLTMLMPVDAREAHQSAVDRAVREAALREVGGTRVQNGMHKDGRVFPLEISLSAWSSESGRFYTGIIRDITERRRASEALRESEESLREVQEIARIGSYSFDLLRDSWRSSPILDDIFGIGAEYPRTAAGWLAIIHPADRNRMREYIAAVYAAQGVFRRTYRIVRVDDGAERLVYAVGQVTYGPSGEPLRMVGTVQDITERELTAEQLRRNEVSLDITLQSIGDGVIATDAAGRVTRMNAMAERLMGWSFAEAAGRMAEEIFRVVDAEEAPVAVHPVRGVLEGGLNVEAAVDTTMISREGRRCPISYTAAPIRDEVGAVEGVVLVFVDVSEEYRVRKALADTAELLERTGEIARIGGWQLVVLDGDMAWTRETYRIHELDQAEPLTLERAITFFAPEARAVIGAALQETINSGIPFDLELPLITAKGRARWVRVLGSAVVESNRTVEVHGALQDITEQRQAAEALRASEEWHRTILQTALVGFWLVDTDGHLVEVNDAYCQMSGYSAAELLSMRIVDLEAKENPAEVQARTSEIFRVGTAGFESQHRRKDGTVFDVDVSVQYHPTRGLSVVLLQDITTRKQAEAELRKLSRAVEQSPASIVITDRNGNIEYVNPRFEQATGYSWAESVGRNPRMLKSGLTPTETYSALWGAIAAGGEWRGEICNRRKDGSLLWEYAAISGLKEENGEVSHFIAVKEDITERKLAQQEQQVLREHLNQMQKMESIGLLAGGVAHDYNNMLAAILGYAELTMRKLGDGHPAYANVEAIKAAAERSAELTRHLLAFARKQVIAPRPMALNDAIGGFLKLLQRMLGEQMRLVWSPGTALWPIQGDPGHIDQVLTNLVVNARDAMEGRDGTLTITTENSTLDAAFVARVPAARTGDFVHLAVRDTGSGMDAHTRAHLFEPFFTTKEPGKGTGLGLSTALGIVQQHGGFMHVESTLGAGSAFHVYFPRSITEPVTPAAADAPMPRGTETVLIAEDDEAVREAMTYLLKALGYHVIAARNGEEALTALAAAPQAIDLLLTDVVMPGMNGAQLRDAVVERHPSVRVLFMSGYAGSILGTEGVLDPATHFLQKPFTMRQMATAVRRVLAS